MRKYYIKLVKIAGFISNLNSLQNCIEYQSINLDMPENIFIIFLLFNALKHKRKQGMQAEKCEQFRHYYLFLAQVDISVVGKLPLNIGARYRCHSHWFAFHRSFSEM